MSEEVDNSTESAADAVAEMAGAETTETTEEVTRPENCPEKFWDDEGKAVRHDDVLKSYNELSGKFGSFTGAPDEYVAGLSDELKEKGVELVEGDPMMDAAMEFAKDSNMSQEGFSKLINMYGELKLAENIAQGEAMQADIASLGDNADRRLNNLTQWASSNLPTEMQEGFKDLAVSADAVKALEQIVSMTRNAKVDVDDSTAAPSVTAEEVEAMQFATDEHGNRLIQISPEHKAKYQRARNLLNGVEPHQTMMG